MATITLQNTTTLIQIPWVANTFTLLYLITTEENETINSIAVTTTSNWLQVDSYNSTTVILSWDENTVLNSRFATIGIEVVTNLGTYKKGVFFNQNSLTFEAVYIDKNININTSKNNIDYTIKLGDEIIFNGKAYALPNEEVITINVNRICQNYLNSNLVFGSFNKFEKTANGVAKFDLFVDNEFNQSFYFYNCYYPQEIPKTIKYEDYYYKVLSNPIKNVIDRRQRVCLSFMPLNPNGQTLKIYTYDKNLNNATNLFDKTITDINVLIATTDALETYFSIEYINFFNTIYEVKDTCATHCLYYANSLGGWDSFLIQGNTKKTDKINGYTYTKNVAVTEEMKDFAKTKYLNEVTTSWVLFTDWLTDEEASKMFNLLESTQIYLEDFTNQGVFIPVNITNKNCEYKTFTNNGKKKFNYTIEVEEANTKIRR